MKNLCIPLTKVLKDMKDLLGGKGANLAEMTKIGPAGTIGFTRND